MRVGGAIGLDFFDTAVRREALFPPNLSPTRDGHACPSHRPVESRALYHRVYSTTGQLFYELFGEARTH